MVLIDLNYNFEFNWLIELSDKKLFKTELSDNNVVRKLSETSYLDQFQSKEL